MSNSTTNSINSITKLAQQGVELARSIKSMQKQLEQIKVDLREYAQNNLESDEIRNAVFDFTDPTTGEIITSVRFPPHSIQLSPNHIDRVVELIGVAEFDRLFTVRQQVITNTDQLENLDSDTAEILGDYITLKENTPRVSFK